ncbi:MAG: DUF6714 family protein [Fimbriiglobus sp.]
MLTQPLQDLISRIEVAFDQVELDDGIGMYEADAIDTGYYGGHVRHLDERHDWRKILTDPQAPAKLIWAFVFVDSKGFRFLLAPLMILSLQGRVPLDNMVLDYFQEYSQRVHEQGQLLNHVQRHLVVDYLLAMTLEYQEIHECLEENAILAKWFWFGMPE